MLKLKVFKKAVLDRTFSLKILGQNLFKVEQIKVLTVVTTKVEDVIQSAKVP